MNHTYQHRHRRPPCPSTKALHCSVFDTAAAAKMHTCYRDGLCPHARPAQCGCHAICPHKRALKLPASRHIVHRRSSPLCRLLQIPVNAACRLISHRSTLCSSFKPHLHFVCFLCLHFTSTASSIKPKGQMHPRQLLYEN